MKFLKKHSADLTQRKYLVCVLVLAVLVLAAPMEARAFELFSIGDILGKGLARVVFGINYVIAYLFGIAVSIISYFLTVIIKLNTNIAQSPLVSSGFPITLALANLGFVLAIIVIAIMTIIRYETYALKSTLWKLVAAAILVNFSLVIGAAILNFADTLTLYFLDAMNPGGSGSSLHNFALSMANAFGPQAVFLSNQVNTSAVDIDAARQSFSFSSILVDIMNLFFPTLFLIISVIALAGLLIMLLIRYVYLGILLILMPLAWLLWIFPVTAGQWHKWWSKFIQWTIFAPVVMFFLYLAILTVAGNKNASIAAQGDPEIINSLASIGFIGNTLGPMLQMATMVALVFAGLFTAQAMGITFAGATLKGATAVTSGFGGFVKRRGKIIGGATMDKLGVKRGATALQEKVGAGLMSVGAGRKGVIGRTVGALTAPVRLAGFGVGMLGRGVEAVHTATREDMVKDAEKRIGSETNDQLVHGMSTFTSPEKIAAMKELGKRGVLDGTDMDYTHRKETKEMFATYGQKNEYEKSVEMKSGASSEMYEALKRGAPQEEIDALAAEFIKKFGRGDVSGMQAADIFSTLTGDNKKFGLKNGDLRKISAATAYGFAESAPQFASTVLSKLKSASLDNFTKDYGKGLENARDRGRINPEEYGKRASAFQSSITNNTMGFVSVAETPAAATAAPTPPPKP